MISGRWTLLYHSFHAASTLGSTSASTTKMCSHGRHCRTCRDVGRIATCGLERLGRVRDVGRSHLWMPNARHVAREKSGRARREAGALTKAAPRCTLNYIAWNVCGYRWHRRYGRRHDVPGSSKTNWWLAMDYLFLWHVQEAMSPGYLRRFERRVQQQNHQSFWLRPSQPGR